MVILDATITNVALPSIQEDLGFTPAGLQWVVNAYTLLFGGFLLLGGRMGDLIGRKRIFIAGVAVFSTASLLCGLSHSHGHADRRAGAAGPRRRAGLPRRAVDHHDDLRGGPGPHEGARRLERDRRGRRRVRPAAGRRADRAARVGVDLLRQRARRHRRGPAVAALRAGVARAGPARVLRHRGRGVGDRRPDRARLRDRQGRELRLGLGAHARAARRWRSRCWPRSWRSSGARTRR